MKINLDISNDTPKKKGRPRKASRKNKYIKVYLPESIRDAFADYCEAQATNCSSYLGNVISQILSGGGLNERKD
jgi:hypothetical protein